jgi:hypothetical protein
MSEELAALRKQESGMQRLDEFEGQVDLARNELESHIFQLQNGLTQELPEHLDAVKVPEYQIKVGDWVSGSTRMILHGSRSKNAATNTGNRARMREVRVCKMKPIKNSRRTRLRTK